MLLRPPSSLPPQAYYTFHPSAWKPLPSLFITSFLSVCCFSLTAPHQGVLPDPLTPAAPQACHSSIQSSLHSCPFEIISQMSFTYVFLLFPHIKVGEALKLWLEWSQYLIIFSYNLCLLRLSFQAPVLFWRGNFQFLASALRRIYFHEIFKTSLCLRILIFACEVQEQ